MGNRENTAHWIWYPGDFEIYHAMLQNFSREERGFFWPAYWYIDSCRKNVVFRKTFHLKTEEQFTVYANCLGYVRVNGDKYRFNEIISAGTGKADIEVFAGSPGKVPSILVRGDVIYTDGSWEADDFVDGPVRAGWNSRYTEMEQDPSIWEYEEAYIKPVNQAEKNGGILYDFGRELTAELLVKSRVVNPYYTVCYGESDKEAADRKWCYYSETVNKAEVSLLRRAFRYVFIPDHKPGDFEITAKNLSVDIPVRASFSCQDGELNQIWDTAVQTFRLCSGIFFIDGVKRDRWIWSGDAYQSYFVNQYLMFDEDINKRTIWALRGNDPVRQHINTIVDYSMYWILGISQHYQMTADKEFVKMIYPRMVSMMDFLENQTDEQGFLTGRKGDWIFIDWADIDKEGPVCAEQMLLACCYRVMAEMEAVSLEGRRDDRNRPAYREKYRELLVKLEEFFWDPEKKAYIDSFVSGRRHVTRHANIFAVLFQIADSERAEQICRYVLENPLIPEITTPYFKFYELEALCRLGKKKEVLQSVRDYWGGMLKMGADTFWEEYDPKKQKEQQYEMYGDPYGKSLCHAWAASPVYLLGRYYAGIKPLSPGYESFEVSPETELFRELDCCFPVKGGEVSVKWKDSVLKVKSSREGGMLKIHGNEFRLYAGKEIEIRVKDLTAEKEEGERLC